MINNKKNQILCNLNYLIYDSFFFKTNLVLFNGDFSYNKYLLEL